MVGMPRVCKAPLLEWLRRNHASSVRVGGPAKEGGAVLEKVRLGGKIHNGDRQILLIAWDEHVYFTAYL